MLRFYQADILPARLLNPVRLDVFATVERTVGKGKRARTITQGCGWQGWNADPIMEARMARLGGAGSFYWSGPITAMHAAKCILATDPRVHQIKLETIGGQELGRYYR